MYNQTREMIRRITPFAIAVLLLGCTAPSSESATDAAADPPVSTAAQTGAVEIVDSPQLVDVIEEARGQEIVVVNFWATWCPPCVEEMPVFAALYQTAASKGVKFISVSVDHPDTVNDRVKPFLKAHSIPFNVYVLRDRSSEAVAKALDINDWTGALPTTLVFDKNGRLATSWSEGITGSDLTDSLSAL
jgi:thiol-disulfide isomerase/thioredoxin